MKKNKLKLNKGGFYSLLMLLCTIASLQAFGQATTPFVCKDGFGYLFQGSPADVFQVNLQTGISTKVKDAISTSAVSAGYNPIDNFIWIVDKGTSDLIKVDANWNKTNFSTPLPRNIHVVDIDANGIFYAYTSGLVYRYDLNTPTPTQLSTLTSGTISVADFAFSPIDGFIYGIATNGSIYKTNPANGSTTVVRTLSNLPVQTYGAVYFDGEGTLYISGNTNGEIYKISNAALTNPASTENAVFFSNGPFASQNDGARCASAPLCKVGTTKPTLNQTSLTNTCSATSVNLANISANNTPDGTILTWHTGSPTTNANRIANLTVSTSGTYYATFYDSENDCYSTSSQSFTVTINPIPKVPTGVSTNKNTLCISESATLSGACSLGSVNWYVNSSNGTLVGTGSTLNVTPSATTTYVATCKSTNPACESSASTSVTITVNPKPAAPTIVAGSSRICAGTSTTLTALGCNGTINWSTGTSGPSITVSPTVQTGYSATCTNTEGCVSDASNSTIQITIANIFFSVDKQNLCSGESVTLTMGGCNATRTFFANGDLINSSTNNIFIDTPAANVTYTAQCGGVAATACATNSTAGVPITVRTTPTPPTLSGGRTICVGSSATLTATGCSGTVNWSNSQTGPSISVSPSTTTSYTATCLVNGCISAVSSTVTVTVEPIPASPTNLADATICAGENVNLGGSCSTGSVVWYNSISLTTTVSMPVSPSSDATYYATCKTTNCQSSSVAIPVKVNPKPNAPTNAVANPSTICQGKSTVLSGNCTAGSSIAFFSNTALTTRLSSATVSPSSTISYFAACELAGCKSNSVQINVTVLPSPTSPTNLTTATTICKGTSILLNGSCPSSSTIQWYQGVVDASSLVGTGTGVSVSPNETTIYVATCKSNTNSCESPQSSNINISVADTPSTPTSVTISSTSVCAGASITLSGNCSSGALKFYTNVGLTDEVTAVNTPSATTTYYATCVIGACKSAAVNRTVEVKPQPIAVASSNTPVCIGSTLQLSAANTVSGAAYSWTGPNNFSSSLQNPTIPNVTGAANGPYNLTVSLNGCTASTSTTVVINQQPNLSLNKTDVLCAGENTGTITVNGSLASPPYMYSRNGVDFQSSNVFIGVSNGFNTITIRDSKGCTNSAQITVEQPLVLNFTNTSNPSTCGTNADGRISVTGVTGGTGPYSYQINTGGFSNVNIFNDLIAGTYAITVRDNNGCERSKNLIVETTPDNIPPTITCPTNISANATAGICGAVVTYTAPVGTDNCSGSTTTQTAGLASGATFPIGVTTNTFRVTDAAGNTTSCSFTVTVADNIPPTIVCPANISANATAGICGAVVTYTAPVGTDNCSGSTTTQTAGLASGATFPIGVTTNTFRVTDAAGNTTSCSFTVTVVDNIPPTITCPANISVNATAGICGAVVTYTAPVGTDNCSGSTTTQTAGLASGSTFPIGTTTNTFTVTDAAGNSTSCSFIITVIDNIPPTITCPANISVNATAGICGAVVTYTAPVGTDNCTGSTTAQTAGLASGATFPVGTTTNTFRVTDAAGNTTSCSFTVTVVDNIPPVITCPANISVNATAGICGAVVTYTAPVGTDNCTGSTTAQTAGLASGATFPVGTTTNTFRVTDAAGNTTSCSFTVTVVDNIPPVITCPANISVNATAGICGAVVTYTAPVGTDNCTGSTTAQTAGLASGATFPIGTTTNTFTVTDAAGNTTSCSFTVTVVDNIPPVITCPANISVNATAGICGAVVTYTAPVGTDNCTGSTTTQAAGLASGATFPVGTTTNTFRVTDAAGNSTSCSFTVTVVDNIPPTITCPANISANATAGICGAVVTYTAPVGTDNCTGSTTAQTAGLASGATFPIGVTTNTFTVIDAAGNTTSCSFTVTVVDNIPPVITCPANISVNATAGICGAVVTYTAPVGTDNCTGSTTTQTAGLASGATFPVGTTTNTFRVTDAAGNSTSCSFIVTVIDNIPPTITCPANISVDNDTDECGAVVNYALPTATDNCTASPTIERTSGLASGSQFPIGTSTVEYTATDAVGNSSTCSFTVTVNDTQDPEITCPTDISSNVQAGTCGSIIAFNLPVGLDNCPGSTTTQTAGLASGSTFPVGTTTNIFTVTDAAGNTTSCSFDVTVIDNIPSVITCPDDISVDNDADECGAIVNYSLPAATDNCTISDPTIERTAGLASGSQFPIGTSTVEYTATDAAGNSSTCTFTITVNDTQNPAITCPANITMNVTSGLCDRATITFAAPTTSDNCAGETFEQIAGLPSGSNFPVGTTTNTFEVTDAAGNKSQCSFDVIINAPPTLVLSVENQINVDCFENATGSFTVKVTGGATPYSYVLDGGTPQNSNAFSNLTAGTYNVVVTDANGCSQSTSTVITEPTQVVVSVTSQTEKVCENTNTGSITVEGSGGTGLYQFKLNDGDFQSEALFTNLASGNYTITVKDKNGCTSTVSAEITTFPQPTPTASSNAPLCVGQDLNLTAMGGVSYAWVGPNFTSDLQNPVIENVTAANAGTYTLTVTSAEGCKASTTTNVVVNPLPIVVSTSNSPVCETKTLNFTTQTVAGASYSWSGPNNFTSNLRNPSIPNFPLAADGVYKLIITNANGCQDSTEVNVEIKKQPLAEVVSNSPICAGDLISLTAADEAGATYSWSGTNGFTSNLQNPEFTATSAIQSGSYEVVVTLDGCTNSAKTDVVVYDLPVANASSNAPICEEKALNFTAENAGSGSTYSWSGPNGFTSNLQNPSIASPSVLASGEYILTVTKNNCVNRDTIDVIVKLRPSVSITPIAPICATETLLLSATATDGVTYAWSGPNSFTSTQQNPEILNVTTSATGVYELIVSLNGCTNSTSISVVVNEKPIASVMGTTPVCEGETVDLSAANAGTDATYSWTGPEGFTSNLQNPSFDNAVPSQSGFYVMTATLGDCSARDSVDIIVNPKPTLSITSATCLPNLLTYEVKLTASGGMVTTSAGEITNDGNGEFTINNIVSGTNIVVTVTSDEDCVVSQEITAPDCSCPVVDAPISEGDKIICRTEDNPVLSVTVGTDETVDWYTTASGGATILENSLTFTPNETAVGTQTYYAQTRNTINQCVSSTRTEVKLTIKPKPEVTVNGVSPICQDDTIRLSSSADLAGVSYQWSGPNGFTAATQNVNIPSAKVSDSGFYKLIVDLNGCTDTDSVEITVKPKPTPIANSNSPVCEGFPIELSVNETAATTYVWSGPKNYSSELPNPSIADATPDMSGTYQVIATLNGCSDTTSTEVVVNAKPTITTTAPKCAVDLATYAVKFTATGGTVVTSAGEIVNDSVKNIPSGTNIKLIITSAEGCQDSTEVIAPDCLCPAIEAPISAGDSAICENAEIPTLEVTVNSDETVDWYDAPSGGNLIAGNTLTFTPTNSAVGENTFYAEARRSDITVRTCVSSTRTPVTLTIKSLPVVIASSNSPVCENDTLRLTAREVSGATYEWSKNGTIFTTKKDTTIVKSGLNLNGTFTLKITLNGCENSNTTDVIIKPLPVVTALSNATDNGICATDTIRLFVDDAANADTYEWTGPQGFTVTGASVTRFAESTDFAGKYVVKSTLDGCSTTDTVTVNLRPLPNAVANNTSPVCAGDSVRFSAATVPNATYEWFDPAGNNIGAEKDIILRNTTTDQSGKYTVKVTLNGCSKVDTTEVIVKHRPVVIGTDVTICSGDTLFLKATRDSTSTYKWVGPLSFTSSAKDTLIAKSKASNSGNYIVTATLNGCSSKDTAKVIVKPLPLTVPLSNSPVCEASPINLSAENAGTDATYAWSGADGFTADVQNPIIDSATLQKAGFYTLTVSRNGCVKTDSVEIEIKQLPQIIFTNNSPICVNDTLKISVQPIAGATYQWSGPKEFMSADSAISIPNIQTDHAGTYQVTLKLNGCEKTDSTTVRVVENPLAEILPNSPVCELDTLKLTAANAGVGAAYEWSGPNNFSSSESNPSVAPMTEVTAGFYYLKVSLNNCFAFDTTEVQFKPLPKINLTSNSPVCVGDTFRISSGNPQTGTTFNWSGPSSYLNVDSIVVITNAQSVNGGLYQLTSMLDGCFRSDSIRITVKDLPEANAAVKQDSLCIGETIKLTAKNAGTDATYRWIGPDDFVSNEQNPDVENVVAKNSGKYILTVTLDDCKASDSVDVFVRPLPEIALDSAFCSADLLSYSVKITANSDNISASAGTVDGEFIRDIPKDIASVKITVISDKGCVDSLTVNAPNCECPVIQLPEFAFTDSTICFGTQSPTFTPILGKDQVIDLYDSSTGGMKIDSNKLAYQFADIQPSTYTLFAETRDTITNCVSASRIKLTSKINPLPLIEIDEILPLCERDTLKLNTQGEGTFEWFGPNGFASVEMSPKLKVDPSDSGEYIVVATLNKCTNSDTVQVIVNPIINVGVSEVFCSADLNTYTVELQTSATNITASAGIVDGKFIREIPKDSASVQITVTSGEGCANTITVNAANCECPQIDLPEFTFVDSTICANAPSPIFVATVGENQTVDFYDAATGGMKVDSMKLAYQFADNEIGSYEVFAESRDTLSNCVSSSRVKLTFTINELPTLEIDSVFCSTDLATYSVKITSNSDNISTSAGIVDGQFIRDIPKDSASVIIRVVNESGCEDSVTVNAPNCECNVVPRPEFSFTVSSICIGAESPIFMATVGDNQTVDFYDAATGGTKIDSMKTSYQFNDNEIGRYEVFAESRDTLSNCVSSSRVKLTFTINALPTLEIDSIFCSADLETYSVKINSNSDNISTSAGIVDGEFIREIPKDSVSVIIKVMNGSGCEDSVTVNAPNCECNVVPKPEFSFTDSSVCIVAESPIFMATVGDNQTVDFYDAITGGTKLDSAKLNFQFTDNEIGSYEVFAESRDTLSNCVSSSRVKLTFTINALPTLEIDSVFCSTDLATYSVKINTNSDNISTSVGIVDGEFIRDIPKDSASVIIKVLNESGCEDSVTVNAPNCECNVVPRPEFSFTVSSICIGAESPIFMATVGDNQTVDFYDAITGGTKLDSAKLNFQFTDNEIGRYEVFAESRDTLSNCVSSSRVKLTFTINALPTLEIDSVFCSTDLATYSVKINTNSDNISTSVGIVDGEFIRDIPKDSASVIIKVMNGSGCEDSVTVNAPNCEAAKTAKINILKTVNANVVMIGDTVTYTIKAWNSGTADTTSVQIEDALYAGANYISHETISGDYDLGTKLWQTGALSAQGDTAVLTMKVKVIAGGPWINSARLLDKNGIPDSIVISQSFVSAIIPICPERGERMELISPTELPTYQWFNNGQPIDGATQQTYIASSAGAYTVRQFKTSDSTCEDGNCHPIIVAEVCECKAEICVPFIIKKIEK